MPVIRRGSTYLDVSTTPHTPEGRLRLDKLCAGRKLAQHHAVCTALLFICDDNRNLGPAETLSVSFEEFKTSMKSRASAANLKWEHGHIDLIFAHNGRQRDVVQQIEIQSSFYDIYRGFQEVLDGYGAISAREKYRAYMSLATKVFGKDRTPTVLQAARCAFQYSRKYQDLASSIRRERDAANSQENAFADNDVNEGDDSMDSMQSEEFHDNRDVPFTPARTLSYSHSNRDIGLPTPESPPRRQVVVSPLSSTASSSEVTPSGNDVHSHYEGDDSMDSMRSEELHDNRVTLFTPARTLSYSRSDRDIGLPTPESLPQRQVVVSLPLSTASSSEVTSSGNDAHSYSGGQNPQTPGSCFSPISLAIGYFAGFVGGFRSSSHMFLPEISSLQAQVTDLQTSLTAAEDALHAANRTTQVSQKRCLGILQDLINARIDIADLKSRAEMDAVEKDNLVQEVGQLKDEVSRLQSGVEQITRIARGLIPL